MSNIESGKMLCVASRIASSLNQKMRATAANRKCAFSSMQYIEFHQIVTVF